MLNLSKLYTTQTSNLDLIFNLPCYVAVKNKNGKYIAANDALAYAAGFQKGDDLVGCTDFDFWGKEAELIKNNDHKVLASGKQLIFSEAVTIIDGSKITAISQKIPLLSRSNKLIGLSVISMVTYKDESTYLDQSSFISDKFSIIPLPNKTLFTERQRECLRYLVKGMTMKQIGKKIGLSPRTVEHYLEILKKKLHCHSRIELIKKGIQLDL